MKKFLFSLLALALLIAPVSAFAAVDIQSNGTSVCTAEHVSFPSGTAVSCTGNTATVTVPGGEAAITSGTIDGALIGDTDPDKGTFTQVVAASNVVSMIYQASKRPASGASNGTIIAISNQNNHGNCGTQGGGTNFVVCRSNGTNWISIS